MSADQGAAPQVTGLATCGFWCYQWSVTGMISTVIHASSNSIRNGIQITMFTSVIVTNCNISGHDITKNSAFVFFAFWVQQRICMQLWYFEVGV